MDKIPPEVKTYLEGLLADAGMSFTDDQMKEEMVKELYARLDNYVASIIVDYLPSEHYETFIKMNEEGKPKEEVENFLKQNLPNAQTVFAKAFADFRQMYLGGVAVKRNEPQTEVPNNAN